MSFDLAVKLICLLSGGAELGVQIHGHQFGAAAITQHAHEGVIAIEQLAAGCGHEDAFLGLLENQPVFFFRIVAVGSVVHDVDGTLLLASVLAVRRGGNHAIAAEAWVLSFLNSLLGSDAVGASFPLPLRGSTNSQ